MKLLLTNNNYNCTVVKVNNLIELEGCDNVVGFPMFGLQAITSKSTEVGSLALLFSVEVELSNDYVSNNNLYRHSELNVDQTQKGYIEDNRRVKAVKFRGHKSSALLMPLGSLSYLGIDLSELKEGDVFNVIDGKEICTKYIIESSANTNKIRGENKRFQKIDNKTFKEHLDSDNYWRNQHKYKEDTFIYVTQKLHGSSGRWGNVLTRKNLSWFNKLINKFIPIESMKYDSIFGSRRVIKNGSDESLSQSYYETDVWALINEQIKDKIPQDWIIYGEIIGWDGQKAIQKNYTYNVESGVELYVYRISVINQQGIAVDLSWDGVMEFCKQQGIKYCPELWRGYHSDFNVDNFMNKIYSTTYSNAVPLSNKDTVDEGLIIRTEGIIPYLTKAKCSIFLEHETKVLDEGEIDLETSES